MKLTADFLLMFGMSQLHQSRREMLAINVGEAIDQLNYFSVYNGAAKFKNHVNYDQAIAMR